MDSGSRKRGLEDGEMQGTKHAKIVQDDVTEAVNEDLPKILAPEVLDVLPIFANMLDVKSFTRLTMTCKDMYKRCYEDKRIKINVSEDGLEVITGRESPKFAWRLEKEKKNREEYVASLRRSSILTLESLCFSDIRTATSDDSVRTACTYLREMNVKSIRELRISGNFLPWEMVNSVIEEFHVKRLEITPRHPVSADTLFSLLHLNLEVFKYLAPVPINVLLQMTSSIPKIEFRDMEDISEDEFMQILGLVHNGALPNLTINPEAVQLAPAMALPYAFDRPIHDDRPLSFHRQRTYLEEYWFLHWHGGVTKCVKDYDSLYLSKCEKSDYPPALKNEEEALQHLREELNRLNRWRPSEEEEGGDIHERKTWRVSCSLSHFRSFFAKLPLLEASHEGLLPVERPLYCTGSEDCFRLLNEHDILMECSWDNGYAEWAAVEYLTQYPSFNHPSLEKYVIRRGFESSFGICYGFWVPGVQEEVLNSVLDGFKTLPMDYDGPLPEERPLLFEKQYARIVLAKDGFVYECEFSDVDVRISKCPLSKIPPILLKGKDVEKFLEGDEINTRKKLDIRMTLETFRSGFDNFKTIRMDYEGPLPEERPLALVKTQDIDGEVIEQCLVINDCGVVKGEWKNGRGVFSSADPREFSLSLTKSLFYHLLKKKSSYSANLKLFMELETVEKCLTPFNVLPFDYDGPVPEDDVVIFTKTEVKEGCRLREQAGDWPEKMMTICMLKESKDLTFATWGAKEPTALTFRGSDFPKEVPPVLKTKEYLKRLLLLGNYNAFDGTNNRRFTIWYGDEDDLHACLNEFPWIPYYFDGDLPEGRPIVFDVVGEYGDECWGIFREDGSVITCCNNGRAITFSGGFVSPPPAIRHLSSSGF